MKRINVLLLIILAAAIGLFGCYMLWVHNNLDTVRPEISFSEGMLEVSVEDPEEKLLQGVKAMDARDGDVTDSVLVESVYGINDQNIATVTYAAFDRAGNVAKTQRQVRYPDYRSPRFELKGSLPFAFGSGFDLLDYIGADDVLDGDIRRRVHATLVSDTKSIEAEGVHQVELQVTNSLGDTVVMTLPVEVYDPEWYTADVELSEYMIYLKQGQRFDPDSYLEEFIVRGNPIDLTRGVPEDVFVEITNTVRMDTPGVYEVKYVLSQNSNLTTYSGIAKLFVVVE